MDRLAFRNMTSKGKNPLTDGSSSLNEFTNEFGTNIKPESATPKVLTDHQSYFSHNYNHGGASLDSFSQPTGEQTSKSKMNNQINSYYLERQSKNVGEHNHFVTALNSNISEDQQRTNVNNDKLRNEQRELDNFQRVYHPGLASHAHESDQTEFERSRNGQGTRDRRENSIAKNKNSPHVPNESDLPTPPPKLNYPQGYGQLKPMDMDMKSHLEMQFQTLTDGDMDYQIDGLQQKLLKNDPQTHRGATPLDRQTYFHSQNSLPHNPHADHMNKQLQQMSRQMPEGRNSTSTQLQNMASMNDLSSVSLPAVDTLGFQRPASSNSNVSNFYISPQQQKQMQMPQQQQMMPQQQQQMMPQQQQMMPQQQQMMPQQIMQQQQQQQIPVYQPQQQQQMPMYQQKPSFNQR